MGSIQVSLWANVQQIDHVFQIQGNSTAHLRKPWLAENKKVEGVAGAKQV
jgi:hypothetical protein